ncbi:MAG: HEPN domain-containing protein [Pseudomonadota bacterium]|nr:HEPN domain-containing protein [Pseudomonadota bacterium]
MIEDGFNQNYRIRLHRASSWLARAEACAGDDLDGRFVFLWVALNAAYARAFGESESEREKLAGFIRALLKVDKEQVLHRILMERFTGPVRTLIENKFVFQPFWQALRDHDSSGRWEQQFAAAKKQAVAAVLSGDTAKVYSIVFSRLYVLRNQLVHGGATCGSRLNRVQLKDAIALLSAIVPVVIGLMEENPDTDWGEIMYPVVGNF